MVVVSALALGLALFSRRPAQPAMATPRRHRRPVTVPSTPVPEPPPVGFRDRADTTAELERVAPAVVPPRARDRDVPAPAERRRGRRARLERDGPGPKPKIRTPGWVRVRAALLLALGVVAVAALVGGVLSVLTVAAGLLLT